MKKKTTSTGAPPAPSYTSWASGPLRSGVLRMVVPPHPSPPSGGGGGHLRMGPSTLVFVVAKVVRTSLECVEVTSTSPYSSMARYKNIAATPWVEVDDTRYFVKTPSRKDKGRETSHTSLILWGHRKCTLPYAIPESLVPLLTPYPHPRPPSPEPQSILLHTQRCTPPELWKETSQWR